MRTEATRFVRFLAVGVLNTLFGLGLYWLLLAGGLAPQAALALAFAAGIAWNYMTHARLVFGAAGWRRFPRYVAAYGLIYLMNAFGLHLLLGAGFSAYLAQAILVLPMAIIAFVLIGQVLTGRLPFAPDKTKEPR